MAQLQSSWPDARIIGDAELVLNSLVEDSREVQPGSAFVARKGDTFDGSAFVGQAIASGASAIVSENALNDCTVSQLILPKLTEKIPQLAAAFHGHPSKEIKLVGVTGTNGKTTIAMLLQHLLTDLFGSCGYLGTVGYDIGQGLKLAKQTTPSALVLQASLAQAKENRLSCVAMECSSHGIDQGRIACSQFDAAIFTNLSQDHLDYHPSFDHYKESKFDLFTKHLGESQKNKRHAIVNLDDDAGYELWQSLDQHPQVDVLGFSRLGKAEAQLSLQDASMSIDGTRLRYLYQGKSFEAVTRLVGAFNVENVLAAIALGHAWNVDVSAMAKSLATFSGVAGRLQKVPDPKGRHIFVDYAHTPDALTKAMGALRPLFDKKIIVVFGCGGDRDKSKRPRMLEAVSKQADLMIVTSDNPRSEDPLQIIEDMKAGLSEGDRYEVEVDRKKAILRALEIAQAGDAVLIAGKGHENYQEIAGKRMHFDDVEVLEHALKGRQHA